MRQDQDHMCLLAEHSVPSYVALLTSIFSQNDLSCCICYRFDRMLDILICFWDGCIHRIRILDNLAVACGVVVAVVSVASGVAVVVVVAVFPVA